MPDIILLAELADFYDVSIPEIIDGERKIENMNEEVKETVLKLSDYTETINQKIKGRTIGNAGIHCEYKGKDSNGFTYHKYIYM